MNFATVDAVCRSLNGAKHEAVLGPGIHCWTVEGRIFATMAEGSERLSVRCLDETVSQLLVDYGRAELLPSLERGSWVALNLSGDVHEVHCRIMESYEMVRADAR